MAVVNMQRAPKLAPAKPTTDLESLEIRVLENGFEVSCRPKPKEAEGSGETASVSWPSSKLYAFSTAEEALAFAGKKLTGASADEYGPGTDEPAAAEGEE